MPVAPQGGLIAFFHVGQIALQFFDARQFDRLGEPFPAPVRSRAGHILKAHQQQVLTAIRARQGPDAEADGREITVGLDLYFTVQRRHSLTGSCANGGAVAVTDLRGPFRRR